MDSHIHQQRLTEYKALRDEILQISRVIMHFILATITVVSAFIGLSFHVSSPWPSLIGTFFAFCSLLYIKSRALGMAKMGTYISLALESQLEAVNWETFTRKSKGTRGRDRLGTYATLGVYTLMYVASLLSFDYLFLSRDTPINGSFLFANISSLIVITLSWIMYRIDVRPWYVKKMEEDWKLYNNCAIEQGEDSK